MIYNYNIKYEDAEYEEFDKITLLNTTYNKDELNKVLLEEDIKFHKYNVMYINIISFIKSLLLFSLYFVYIIFSFFSLYKTSYYQQKDLCYLSNLWLNCLLYIFSNISLIYLIKSNYNKILSMFIFFTNFSLLLWLFWEFFGIECVKNLNNTLIYTISEINLIIGIVFVIGSLFYIQYKLYD